MTQSALPAKVIYGQKYRVARNWKVRPYATGANRHERQAYQSLHLVASFGYAQQKRYVRRALVGHTDWVLCLQADSDKVRTQCALLASPSAADTKRW